MSFVIQNENKVVARLSEVVSLAMGYSPAQAKRIKTAAALHDVGKLAVPKSIVDKPGKLTAQEFEIMKTHTKTGAAMLSSMQGELGKLTREVCEFHHEKWDGSGYWGISARELPGYVGIVSICDVYAALIHERVYKPAWSAEAALDYIKSKAGTQFSPELVRVFIPLIRNESRVPAIFIAAHSNAAH
jgi:putative two-component system response regulator